MLGRIVYYVRVFPDCFHHPKEEKFLFPALRSRDP
jgi:hemerythrin-like domain-containing protein